MPEDTVYLDCGLRIGTHVETGEWAFALEGNFCCQSPETRLGQECAGVVLRQEPVYRGSGLLNF